MLALKSVQMLKEFVEVEKVEKQLEADAVVLPYFPRFPQDFLQS